MVAYFLRRSLGAVVAWFLALWLIYLVVMPQAISLLDYICLDCGPGSYIEGLELQHTYSYEKNAPLNYLTWIFGSEEAPVLEYHHPGYMSMGGYARPRTYYFERQTVITGNWGRSMKVSDDTPVLDMYGIDLQTFLIVLTLPMISLMLIATVQRRGRSATYSVNTPESPSRRMTRLRDGLRRGLEC